jgi:hypothetical protein
MPLPALEKTWQYNVNQTTATSGNLTTDCQNAMLKIKLALVGFTNAHWTVISSSNASLAGTGDHWASTASNLTWNSVGQIHSWIVLQQTGINVTGTTQICIDLLSSGPSYTYNFTIAFSPSAGFTTGGTTSARPTASDEFYLDNQTWFPTSAANTVLHVMQSSTGACTRVFLYSGGTCYCNFIVDTLYSDSPLTYKGVFSFITNPIYYNIYTSSVFHSRYNSINFAASIGLESYISSSSATHTAADGNSGSASDLSSAYPMCPISLHSTTPGARGRLGRLSDIFIGSTAITNGSSYPATGYTFAQFGGYIVPWNGTAPVIT